MAENIPGGLSSSGDDLERSLKALRARLERESSTMRGALVGYQRDIVSYIQNVKNGVSATSPKMVELVTKLRGFSAGFQDLISITKTATAAQQAWADMTMQGLKKVSELDRQTMTNRINTLATAIARMRGLNSAEAEDVIKANIAIARSVDGTIIGQFHSLQQLYIQKESMREGEFEATAELNDRLLGLEKEYADSIAAINTDAGKMALAERHAIMQGAHNEFAKIIEQDAGILGDLARHAVRAGGAAAKTYKDQQDAAEGKKVPQTFKGAAIEMIAAKLGPSLANLTKIGLLMATVGELISTVVEGVDRTRKVGGQVLVGDIMMSGKALGSSVALAGEYNKRLISSMGGMDGVMEKTIAFGGSIMDDLLPPAAAATATFGRMGSVTAPAFTAAFIKVAGIGAMAGKDLESSMTAASEAWRAFGGEAKRIETIFETQWHAAAAAGLSFDELASAMGSVIDLGKMWGDQEKSYETMSRLVGDRPGMTNVKKQLAIETLSGAMKVSPNTLIGQQMFASGGTYGNAVKSLVAGNKDMAKYTYEQFNRMMEKSGGKELMKRGMAGDFEALGQGAQIATKLLHGGDALLASALTNKDIQKILVNQGSGTDAFAEFMKTATDEPAVEGLKLMRLQKSSMDMVADVLREMLVLVSSIASSSFLASMSGKSALHSYVSQGNAGTDRLGSLETPLVGR